MSEHPFNLTPLQDATLDLLFSKGFPNPSLTQISAWSTFGPVSTAVEVNRAKRCKAKRELDALIAIGLCELRGERYYYPTPLAEAYKAYSQRGRALTHIHRELEKTTEQLNALMGFVGYLQRSLDRTMEST